MKLTYKFKIPLDNKILELCKVSKNLYNQGLYLIKQNLDKNNKFLFYSDLDKLLKITPNLEGKVNYRLLKTQSSQQILRLLEKDIKSYIKSIKDYSKNKGKYKGVPKLPKFKKDYNLMIYTNQCCQMKNNKLILSKELNINIPQFNNDLSKFNQVRIIPKDTHINVEIIYEKECLNPNVNKDKYCSIDLGVNNLMTIITDDKNPLIISGKQLKSINQFYNKEKAKLKSELPNTDKSKIFNWFKDSKGNKVLKQVSYSKKLRKLDNKRNDRINDILHKVSKYLINYCIDNKIGNIVIGYNKNWKTSIKLGNKTNQTFVSIPYLKLIKMIEYKSKLNGINLVLTEESYTSKCDGLVKEEMKHHSIYLGKRIERGLFKSSIGKAINADVNGALNILRKHVINESYVDKIIDSGLLFNPIKIKNIFNI